MKKILYFIIFLTTIFYNIPHSAKEIEIFDVNSKTASAKLTAEWGIDLFHLAKINDQWKIVNVIWQSQPEQKK